MSKSHRQHLGQFFATSIAGNDILSSVLYTSGLVIPIAGIYTPFIFLLIGLVLLFYKGVYREVVEAMPINGGCYNALLNGTSKRIAATAGVLTILSYIATAVISAKSGVEYLATIIPTRFIPEDMRLVIILGVTIIVLAIFAGLVVSGVKDSAIVAAGIFSFHILTLTVFLVLGGMYIFQHGSHFIENISTTQFSIDNLANSLHLGPTQAFVALMFLAFSASLLGVSGFESSANFVEEQKKGVFKKTLRNMLIAVVIFNPLVAFVALSLSTIPEITVARDFLLSDQAFIVGGSVFRYILVVDAFLVLCGAVLTAFVGVSGLMNRMSLDECFPRFLTRKTLQGSFPVIIGIFFLLCTSILFITKGDISSIGGVYAISFLSVMSMFACANIILKNTREKLKRYYSFPVIFAFFALISTLIGVIGNVVSKDGKIGDLSNLFYFFSYFIPLLVVVMVYIYRDYVIQYFAKIFRSKYLLGLYNKIIKGRYVVFVHSPVRLFRTLQYVNNNETGTNVLLVHCKDKTDEENAETWNELQTIVPVLKNAGVYSHINLELIQIDMSFGPEAIKHIVDKYQVLTNHVFIGSIHHYHSFDYDELGGVRIIT